jgi:YD repeat-containing protein
MLNWVARSCAFIGLPICIASAVSLTLTPLASAATYRETILADDPAGWWRLGEVSGNFADASSGGHPGTLTLRSPSQGTLFLRAQPGSSVSDAGAVLSNAAPSGYPLRPDGAYVDVVVGNGWIGGRDPFSFEVWVKPKAHENSFNGGILGCYPMVAGSFNVGSALMMTWPSRAVTFARVGDASNGVVSAPLAADEWSQIVGTYDGTTMRLYLNAQLQGETASTHSLTVDCIRIGMFDFDYGFTEYPGYFYGYLDEAVVYKKALTAAQVRAHYEANAIGAYRALTFGAGGGGFAVNPRRLEADPVNTATGNYWTSATDLALPGIGVPFTFTRTYNSLDTTAGPLGPGWTHAYNVSLSFPAPGRVIARAGDGQQLEFTQKQDGSYAAAAGGRSTLTAVGSEYELLLRDQTRHRFDAQGRLTSLRDRNGQGLTFAYAGGRLTTITDSVGRQIALTYNGDALLSEVALPDGRKAQYGYTGGRLTSVIDARGGTTTYRYDAAGRLDKLTDQKGRTVAENTYGADGRVLEQLNGRGHRGSFAWDSENQVSTYTDARGKLWKDFYSNNVLIKRVDPLGNATRYEYDLDLNLVKVTDARGNATTMTYDSRGNLLTRTAPAPLSYQEVFTYDAQNNLLSARDGRGNTTSYEYDAAGNLVETTEPGNVVTTYGRDPGGSGLLTSMTDPRGKLTRFEYAQGNLTKVTSPLGNVTTMAYDSSGRMTSSVEPRGNVAGGNPDQYRTTLTYDNADHPLTHTHPLGSVTTWSYDEVGNLAGLADAKNRTTSYSYDAANHLTSVTAPDSSVTSYAYDPVGNLTSRTDAKSHVTSYAYDDANRLVSVTTPLQQLWTYGYDANGNRTQIVDAIGNATPAPGDGQTTLAYDALNRLTGIDYSDATPDVGFTYDGNGNRTQMTDGQGTETYVYDPLDRLESITRGANAFSYGYDAAGNVTRRTYPDGTVVDYAYDDDTRLASVTSAAATTTYQYDAASNLTLTALPAANGYEERRTYDRTGRLTEVENAKGAAILSRYAYTLDAVGNPTASPPTTTTRLTG